MPAAGGGWLPNPFSDDGPPLTARAWAQLANLKSSDRRVLIADDGHGGLTALGGHDRTGHGEQHRHGHGAAGPRASGTAAAAQ